MSASNSILHVNQLDAWFGNFHALKNISVDVKDHDVMALIGPSGCGKSTFIRCLNRLHEEIEGAKYLWPGQGPCGHSSPYWDGFSKAKSIPWIEYL